MKTLDGLHPTLMRPRVEAVLADPDAQALGVTIVSAFRSNAYQAVLFAKAVAKYGSAAKARKWVAPPGKSNHGPRVDGYGTAVDFGVRGVKAVSGQWPTPIVERFDAIAARHGLYSPMEWEDWHFEPIKNWTPAQPEEDDDVALTAEQEQALALIPDINHHLSAKTGNVGKLLDLCRSLDRRVKALEAAAAKK